MDMAAIWFVMMAAHIVHTVIQLTAIILILEEAGAKPLMATLHTDIVMEVMVITPTGHTLPMEIMDTVLLTPGRIQKVIWKKLVGL